MLGAMNAFGLRISFAFCFLISSAHAQTTPGKPSFALPVHQGRMTLEQGAWQVSELSLKGETFPDPTEDDSLRKLQKDDAFRSLAQQVSQQLKLEKKP